MEQPVFHVVLEGRKVGPYDRRTIVGMRIKKTLDSDHVLIDGDGNRLTVADLIGRRPRTNDFNPNRSQGFSVVQATYPACLVQVDGSALGIPNYRGEMELRVQSDVLRIAGRFRKGFGRKESRVKLPIKDVVHARVRGSQVELWLRAGQEGLHRVALELFTPAVANELVDWLPAATPWPEADAVAALPLVPAGPFAHHHVLWVSVGSIAAVVGVVLTVLMLRRLY
ncbi:MAG TPA: hypothetical protein VLJ58_02645 [Ramlibacter sp.]|nr:hypothetical protein [Ramlibacter sp.]